MKVFLKKIGFSRVVVGTVKEALTALDKQHFDLLFLDLKLPDGPADNVYDAAKKIDPELAIIIITGYPDSEMLDRVLEKGPTTVLKNRCKWTSCTRPCGFFATRKSRKRRNSIAVLLRSHGNTVSRLAFFRKPRLAKQMAAAIIPPDFIGRG